MRYSFLQLEYFYWVSVHQSFIGAAKELAVSKAHVSQSIAKLEREIGHTLFHRTTRVVNLTQVGERLLPYVEKMISLKRELGRAAQEMRELPVGLIRLTCPNAFAECYLSPTLPDFLRRYPEIKLEMRLSSQLIDLERHKIDLAIRLTHEPPLDKVAKQLGHYQIGYFATPAYLKKMGTPDSITALKAHNCLVSTTVLSGVDWAFMIEGERVNLMVKPYLEADNHHIIKSAALSGMGIACLPSFLVMDQRKEGLLVPILESQWMPSIPVYAVYSRKQAIPVKISLFLDFLKGVIDTRQS